MDAIRKQNNTQAWVLRSKEATPFDGTYIAGTIKKQAEAAAARKRELARTLRVWEGVILAEGDPG